MWRSTLSCHWGKQMVQKVQFSLKKTKCSLFLFICNGMNRLTENASSIDPLLAWLSWAFNTSDWTQMENLHALSHFKPQHKTFSALNHRPTSELLETSQISVFHQFHFSISYSLLFSTVACNATWQRSRVSYTPFSRNVSLGHLWECEF